MSTSTAHSDKDEFMNEKLMYSIMTMTGACDAPVVIELLRDHAIRMFRTVVTDAREQPRSDSLGGIPSKETCDAAMADVLCKISQFESWASHKRRALDTSNSDRATRPPGYTEICPQQVFVEVRSVAIDMYAFIADTVAHVCFDMDYPDRVSIGPCGKDTDFEKYRRACRLSPGSSPV